VRGEEQGLSEKFAKGWRKGEEDVPLAARIKEAVRRPGPLKPRLDSAVRQIKGQIQRLDQASDRFSKRDRSLFARLVKASSKHDTTRANVLANELAEMRKMEKLLLHSRLALEQIVLRLSTVSELGDVVSTLAPAVDVLQNVRNGIGTIFPEAERELGNIGNILGGIMMEVGPSKSPIIDFEEASGDAQTILEEAATIAEQEVQEKFPELPSDIPPIREKQKLA
jgi:division protein CdvB (Snf7/Vps24/ESCRT-III family)